ncbi:MAG: hypothetical protein V3S00_02485 [Dehalococcoidia bacterium]
MMSQRTVLTALVGFLAIATVACDGGGDSQPSATPQPDGAETPGLPPTPNGTATEDAGARTIDLATASPLTVVYAVEEGDLLSDQPGLAAGDFNGDGIDDILIGARFADGPDGREDSGAAYIVLGSQGPPDAIDLAEEQQEMTIIGARPGDGLGFSAAAADLDGDGIDDIVVGAPFAGPHDLLLSKQGRVYVFFGRPDLPDSVDLATDTADLTLAGTSSNGFFGDSLAAGDVNGDGTADLIVGATFDSYTPQDGASVRGGAMYVFLGREAWRQELTAGDADIVLLGADDLDELGDFVTSGDINGDGIDDIIGTAEAADGPDNTRDVAAEVHVLFGGTDVKGTFEIARDQQDFTVYGARDRDTLGFSLATGDLDGDGIDELVMGARLASASDNADDRSGQVYVLYGRRDLPAEVDLASPPEFVGAFLGARPSDFLGTSGAVAGLGDNDANQLIMGSIFADAPNRRDAGAVYISEPAALRGALPVMGEALRVVIYGAATGDRLGANVIAADFNGDGRLELIVVAEGAAGPDESRAGAGRIYVIAP